MNTQHDKLKFAQNNCKVYCAKVSLSPRSGVARFHNPHFFVELYQFGYIIHKQRRCVENIQRFYIHIE